LSKTVEDTREDISEDISEDIREDTRVYLNTTQRAIQQMLIMILEVKIMHKIQSGFRHHYLIKIIVNNEIQELIHVEILAEIMLVK